MANCVNYGCSSLSEHIQVSCDGFLGGVANIIVLNCDHSITDPSDAIEVQAAIDAGEAIVVSGVKVGMDAASAIEVESLVSCQPPKTINYDRSLSFIDESVEDNVGFFNELFAGRAFGGVILHLCDADKVVWVDDAVSFQGSVIIPNDNTELIRAEGIGKWKSKTNPLIYNTPAGIF